MGRILDSFIEQLPNIQASLIEKELQGKRASRQVRSTQEFRQLFQDKLRELLASDTLLRFQSRELLADTKRSSELVETMLSLIADDLSALFQETNSVADLTELQTSIFRDEIIGRLHRAVDEATREIERLEALYGNTSGLQDVLVEKFRISSSRLPRTDRFARDVYVDPKLGLPFDSQLDMPIEVNIGGLVLPVKQAETLVFSMIHDQTNTDVRSFTDRYAFPNTIDPSTEGDIEVQQQGSILNLIDRTSNTWWLKKVQTRTPLVDGAKLTLKLTVGQPREINFIEVQPFGPYELELSNIYYVNDRAIVKEMELGNGTITVKEPTRIFFKAVFATDIVLVFTQYSPKNVRNIAGGLVGYEYNFGLDNILAGNLIYQDTGYFVSRTITAPQITTLSLAAKENNNVVIDSDETLNPITNPLPTVEYWIHFRELDASGNVVYSTMLPIVPLGTTSIREKLHMRSNFKAYLNFMIDRDLDDGGLHSAGDLILYRDGVAITRPEDYELDGSMDTLPIEERAALLSIPDGFAEQKEYIAQYVPLHIKNIAPVELVDPTGLIRYNRDSSIVIERPAGSRAVESQVNLLIIMRNAGSKRHTAVVDEFRLAIG